MSPLADAHTSEHDGIVVARLGGEVDLSNADELEAALTGAVPNTALGLVVDLTGTSFLGSSGVSLLFDLAERLRDRQQQLRLAVPDDSPLWGVLEIVDIRSAIPVAPTAIDAVAALRAAVSP